MAAAGHCECLGGWTWVQLPVDEVIHLVVWYASLGLGRGQSFLGVGELTDCRTLHSVERKTGEVEEEVTSYDELHRLGK